MTLPLPHHLCAEFERHLGIGSGVESLVLSPQSTRHLHERAVNVCIVLGRGLYGVQHVFTGCISLGLIIGDLP